MRLRLPELAGTAAIVLLSFVLLPASLFSQDTGWTIPSFDAAYTVNTDRSIDGKTGRREDGKTGGLTYMAAFMLR